MRVEMQRFIWSTYPTITCSLKKDENLYFIISDLFYNIPEFIVSA